MTNEFSAILHFIHEISDELGSTAFLNTVWGDLVSGEILIRKSTRTFSGQGNDDVRKFPIKGDIKLVRCVRNVFCGMQKFELAVPLQ